MSTPVTLITGFLGAGKTTLLNRLLKHPDLAETAVLINEFGDVGLDHLLVETLDDTTMLLAAGCLCCTIRGDLHKALMDLTARIESGQPIRRVMIETTGLADPAPILHTLMSDPVLLRRFRLDGVITLIDATNAMHTLDAHPEALKQAAVADRIILTKTDLGPDTAPLRTRLADLNPHAPILAADAEPAALLDLGPFQLNAKLPDVAHWLGHEAGHAHHHHHHDRNRHDAHIHSFTLRYDQPLTLDAVASFLEMLVTTRGDALLRVKAILNIQGEDRPTVLHGVQHIFHPPIRLSAWPDGDDRSSRFVFIVKDLTRETVERGLAAFIEAA
ncbi:CobW family GTP-binding protein [Plastoroseomonas arctica]|uniref:GTP-binding protein n=1 Tax=Plastoroseomonas arctica TaxID=1509237 RepID=A0AAF1K530_9PROT|nr:GTP-binding protein [Plastoroseomonas arctica]MBR0655985.1 GTP-binding protein [Plastoroseomonas arctica]